MTNHLNPDGTVRDQPDPQARALAITNCHLCDPDGYRGTLPCDHTDHRPAAQRGIALIRAQMGWDKQSPQTHPENPGECDSQPAINTPDTPQPPPNPTTRHKPPHTPPAPHPHKI